MDKVISRVANYYSERLSEFGATAKGVDWNGGESQYCRFEQLSKVLPALDLAEIKILDFGCGYGAYLNFLKNTYSAFKYIGVDISKEMIIEAERLYGHLSNVEFLPGNEFIEDVDFVICSGVFNVKLNSNDSEWLAYIHSTLDLFNQKSRKGFAFNCLTSYSDEDKKRDHLYYASPEKLFKFCKDHFSKNVALLHDYELYEFTIIVRK